MLRHDTSPGGQIFSGQRDSKKENEISLIRFKEMSMRFLVLTQPVSENAFKPYFKYVRGHAGQAHKNPNNVAPNM